MSTVALRGVVAGTLIVAVTILPLTLCGVLAVRLSSELGLSNDGLGVIFAVFFASAALSSTHLGRFTERVGARAGLRLGALSVGVAALLIATVVRHWATLIPLMAVVGAGSALTRPAAGLWIARLIPRSRQGFALGVNHTSVLVAMLTSGLAVPAVALPFGWRATFLIAAALAVLTIFALPSERRERLAVAATQQGANHSAASPDQDLSQPTLRALAVAAALGTAGASSLGAFTVPTLIHSGVEEAVAGTLVAASSAVGLVSRVGAGIAADRWSSVGLLGTAAMIVLGAGAFLLLGAPSTALVMLGVPLAYATAWSWLGLFNLAMLRLNPHAPGAAIGVTQVGPFVGGVVGPLGLGLLAERLSFQVGWGLAALLALLSAAGLVAVHRRVRARLMGRASSC